MRGLNRLRAISPRMTGLARRGIAAVTIGAIVLAVSTHDPKEAMAEGDAPTARQLAQGLYDSLAAQPQFGGTPFTPSRLANLKWANPLFGMAGFRSRDAQWEQQGQTWPDDTPNWLILAKQPGNILNRINRLNTQGIYRPLHNEARAERWGRSLFTLGHELGHNYTSDPVNFNEGSADYWSKTHFREYGRTLGLDRHQLNRMWRANNGFAGVKQAPQ